MTSPNKETKNENNWFAEKLNMNKLKFYHGVITKEDVQLLMKEAAIGDYLLRSAFSKEHVVLFVFLCVKVDENEVDEYYLLSKDEKVVVKQEKVDKETNLKIFEKSPPFNDYEEMIKYYRVHKLACGLRLNRSVARPKWQLRHSDLQYNDTGKLGAGNFCIVYQGKLKRSNGKEEDVAIKVSKCDKQDDSLLIMATRNALFAEAKIMTAYNHTNVIKLFGICCDNPPFLVCMEFCVGGSLESHLYKHGKEMEEFERQTILIDACQGMKYLSGKKCVHRDLAARNCLISSDGIIKIADFGLSKKLSSDETAFKEALKEAPLTWLAPECLQKESEFSTKSDVWAFGVLIYEVYFDGQKPFANEKDTGALIRAIRKANMPLLEKRTTIPKMDDMLTSIWKRKPEDRIDFQKVLEFLVGALIPANSANLKRMQLNKLAGVTRESMPNTELVMKETCQELVVKESSSRVFAKSKKLARRPSLKMASQRGKSKSRTKL